jgi:hypothetical protein
MSLDEAFHADDVSSSDNKRLLKIASSAKEASSSILVRIPVGHVRTCREDATRSTDIEVEVSNPY